MAHAAVMANVSTMMASGATDLYETRERPEGLATNSLAVSKLAIGDISIASTPGCVDDRQAATPMHIIWLVRRRVKRLQKCARRIPVIQKE